MLCLGNKQISPTLITEVGAYGDDMKVLNLTGNTLNVDDKVWISSFNTSGEATETNYGSEYYTYPIYMSRDGETIYYPLSGKVYNITSQTEYGVASCSAAGKDYTHIRYTNSGLVFVQSYSAISQSSSSLSSFPLYNISSNAYGYSNTTYTYCGNNLYYDNNNSVFVKIIDDSLIPVATYTSDVILAKPWANYSAVRAGNYLYYLKTYKSGGSTIGRALIDDTNLTIMDTSSDNVINSSQIMGVTSDGKYFIGANDNSYMKIYQLIDGKLVQVINPSDDLNIYCNNSETCVVFNEQADILTIQYSGTTGITFRYTNGKFIKVSEHLFTNGNLGIITSDDTGTVMAAYWNRSSGWNPIGFIVQYSNDNNTYKAIPFNNNNISTISFSGYVTEGGAHNENVKVKTILPPKLNVSVTVNANDAEISGGIE